MNDDMAATIRSFLRGDEMSDVPVKNFYKGVIQQDDRYYSPNRIDDINLLEPVTRAAVLAIIADAKVMGREMMVFETYRSQDRQEDLYYQGATQLWRVGVHHYGLACDIVKVVDGEPSWDGSFGFLRDLAQKHGLISGLDWGRPDIGHSFIDPCHVQRIRVCDQKGLFSGAWYPGESYNPFDD